MLVDARSLELQSVTKGVCIIGSGPAGITLAREFIGQNIEVCLLESGGTAPDPQVRELADGFTVGEPIIPPAVTGHRQVGGNSNMWSVQIGAGQIGVRYVPLDDIDFEKRDWLPNSGWPFDKAYLVPFYERAQKVCYSGPFEYDPSFWQDREAQPLPLENSQLETAMFQFGPSKAFHHYHREELTQSDNITIYSNATVVEVETNEAGKAATRVRVACLNGKQFWVSAKVFVIACGGFENARLLLMSNHQQKAGLGNQYDVVGRYYNDHPLVVGGRFVPRDPNLFNKTALYDLRRVNGFPVMGHLKLSREVLQREELLNLSAVLFPRPGMRQMRAFESLKYLAKTALSNEIPGHIPSHLLKTVLGLDYIAQTAYLAGLKKQPIMPVFAKGGWSELSNKPSRFKDFEVVHQIEQTPKASNRVTLREERDALGCPKMEVHWRWSQDDADRISRAQGLIAQELERAGLGEFQVEQEEGRPKIVRPSGTVHLMGTTRMHEDPKQGVVDANCQVHGLSNLFVAGCSVFPTGGYANPTLTIVALSLRLGDFIKQELEKKAVAMSNV